MTKFRNTIGMLLAFFMAVPLTFAEEHQQDLEAAVAGNNSFAFDLYAVLKKEKGNLFLSPYSISSALAIMYAGARGETAEEMAKALHFAGGADKTHQAFSDLNRKFENMQKAGQVQLHAANSLWPQKGYELLPDYLELVKQHYGASITPVDYTKAAEKAAKLINAWVEEKTKDKIKNLIRPGNLDPLTVLILVNAVYFKGNWAEPFDPKRTKEAEFTGSNDAKVRVSMMYQKAKFEYGETENAQLLELPYVGKDLSMVIILPKEPKGLSKVEDQLTLKNFDSWASRMSRQNVNVYLPKFKITWGTFELNKPLKALGICKAFGPADFSGMDGTRTFFVQSVLHKAFVEVNEEGTEAAAATAVAMKTSLPKINTFKADHPFLFLIKDNVTGSILFLGRFVNPESV